MLKQTHSESEENNGVLGQQWRSDAPPRGSEVSVPPNAGETRRRYDADSVRDALSLAARLQTEQQTHHETMSEEELVETGAEVGIDPEFIRRAIAMMEDGAETASSVEKTPISAADGRSARVGRSRRATQTETLYRTVDTTETRLYRKLSRRAKIATALVPLVFFLFTLIVGANSPDTGLILVSTILGPLLAITLGAGVRSLRLGALAGALTATALFLTLLEANPPHSWNAFPFAVFWALMLLTGAILGIAGALGRRLLPRLFLRLARRFPVLLES